MAFDISTLNGIFLTRDMWASVTSSDTDPKIPHIVDSVRTDGYTYNGSEREFKYGQIIEVDATYRPGFAGYWGGYYQPIVGRITLDVPSGPSHPTTTLDILGFSEDMMLVARGNYTYNSGIPSQTFIISKDGIDPANLSFPLEFTHDSEGFVAPDRPVNPFAEGLEAMDGVTFENGTMARVGEWIEEQDPKTFAIYGTEANARDASKITVVNTYYRPGYSHDDGTYTLPTFGKIHMEGFGTTEVIDGEDVYVLYDFYIHGFGEDGKTLLLTGHPRQATGPNGQGVPEIINDSRTYILSLDGSLAVYDPDDPGASYMTFNNEASRITAFETELGVPVCFAEGTRIATVRGLVAVEQLAEGDVVITASGEQRPVIWIGQMTARPACHPRPHEVNPVRVRAHAFGPDLPARDLRLSPGHAVFVDGVLVPVGQLINGATIVQEAVEAIRYFHVELESHDVLLAEGLPCESYLDDGNRASFANAGRFAELHGRLDPRSWDDACAPLVADGPQLTAIQQRLQAQAEALGWERSEEPMLRMVADGAELAPVHAAGERYWFAAPAAASLVLRSASSVLAQVMPGLEDRRRLGVAITDLRVNGEGVDLDAAVFGAGFYGIERNGDEAWRWTDGEAGLSLNLAAPAMIEVRVAMVAPSWRRKATGLRVVA